MILLPHSSKELCFQSAISPIHTEFIKQVFIKQLSEFTLGPWEASVNTDRDPIFMEATF